MSNQTYEEKCAAIIAVINTSGFSLSTFGTLVHLMSKYETLSPRTSYLSFWGREKLKLLFSKYLKVKYHQEKISVILDRQAGMGIPLFMNMLRYPRYYAVKNDEFYICFIEAYKEFISLVNIERVLAIRDLARLEYNVFVPNFILTGELFMLIKLLCSKFDNFYFHILIIFILQIFYYQILKVTTLKYTFNKSIMELLTLVVFWSFTNGWVLILFVPMPYFDVLYGLTLFELCIIVFLVVVDCLWEKFIKDEAKKKCTNCMSLKWNFIILFHKIRNLRKPSLTKHLLTSL